MEEKIKAARETIYSNNKSTTNETEIENNTKRNQSQERTTVKTGVVLVKTK